MIISAYSYLFYLFTFNIRNFFIVSSLNLPLLEFSMIPAIQNNVSHDAQLGIRMKTNRNARVKKIEIRIFSPVFWWFCPESGIPGRVCRAKGNGWFSGQYRWYYYRCTNCRPTVGTICINRSLGCRCRPMIRLILSRQL